MNARRIAAVARKEWREIVRDRLFLSLAFVVPAMLMLLFGFGLSMDVEHVPFAVLDRDGTAASRAYTDRFRASPYFDFRGKLLDERELTRALTASRIRLAIVIPDRFQENVLAGRPVSVETLIDGTFPFRAQTIKGYVAAIDHGWNVERMTNLLATRGVPREQAEAAVDPLRLEVRTLYNQSVRNLWSLAPKLIMAVLMIATPLLTALGVVREKESGAIYNVYSSTLSRGEFLVGKLGPYAAISLVNAAGLWLLATRFFGAPFKGSLGFFGAVTVLYVVCTTGIGLLASVWVRTQIAAITVVFIVAALPAFLYSGLMVPISSLRPAGQLVAHLLPAMYYTRILIGCFLKGVGPEVLWPDVLVLGGYATALFALGYVLFVKRPDE